MQVAVLLYPGVTALDAIGPYEVLRFMPDTTIRFVAVHAGPVVTDSGVLALSATHTLAETPNPDIVVVPGGPGAIAAAADRTILDWLRHVHATTTWTTSVCTGSLVLASAGLLDDRPATTHWAAQQALARLGARPRPTERFVTNGRIATAAGVSAGIDLALWLVGELHGPERAQVIQLDIEYDPHPPFDAGHPDKASKAVQRAAFRDQFVLSSTSGVTAKLAVAVPTLLWRDTIRRLRGRRATPIDIVVQQPSRAAGPHEV